MTTDRLKGAVGAASRLALLGDATDHVLRVADGALRVVAAADAYARDPASDEARDALSEAVDLLGIEVDFPNHEDAGVAA